MNRDTPDMQPEIVPMGVSEGIEARINFDGTDLWLETRSSGGDNKWVKAARRVDRVWVPMNDCTAVKWPGDESPEWN
jgi:hypothetical protein